MPYVAERTGALEKVPLGMFHVKSGALFVSDPCYTRDTWCTVQLDNVQNGEWAGFIYHGNAPGWGDRVWVLEALLGSPKGDWSLTDGEVGVDSGQAGIFDYDSYGNGDGEYGDTDTWYGRMCETTRGEISAGVQPEGIVSSSGIGDGGYSCYVKKTEQGSVIGVRIVFLTEEDNEDNESLFV